MSKHIHIGDEGPTLAGASSPSSHEARRGTGKPVIQVYRSAPPPVASVDAVEPDGESSFVPIGSIAVRLMAAWTLPRMSLVPIREEYDRHQLPRPQSREED